MGGRHSCDSNVERAASAAVSHQSGKQKRIEKTSPIECELRGSLLTMQRQSLCNGREGQSIWMLRVLNTYVIQMFLPRAVIGLL
eukprot:3807705-Pleurochrysis_carterae.AAC.1